MYRYFFKRLSDILLSSFVIILISPFLLVIFVLIKLDSRGPIFFLQQRVGMKGKVFCVYKLRTMIHKKRATTSEIFKGNPEVTRMGYIMRRLKIDELPQFFNVLLGDMSLVGPRPALPQLYEKYPEISKDRLLVRPGITGWAQVHGNIYLSWEDRFRLDSFYVHHLTFGMDVRVILKTLAVVIIGEDKFVQK